MSLTAGDTSDLVQEFDTLLGGAAGDVADLYAGMRAGPPIFSEKFNGWVFSSHHDVRAVLGNENGFPPLLIGPGTAGIYGRTVLQMSGAEHATALGPVARSLRAPNRLDSEIREVVERVAQSYVDGLNTAPDVVDLRADFFSPYPMAVIADLMGVPAGAEFRTDYGTVVRGATSNVDGDPEIHRAAETARLQVCEFLDPHIRSRMENAPAEDLMSTICAAARQGSMPALDAAKAYALFLFVAGVETTERALTNLVARAVADPSLWLRLRDDRDIISSAIIETLRLDPPVHAVSRGVAEPAFIGGTELAPGDRVLVVIGAANRDGSVFQDPERFDPARFVGREAREFTPASEILTFGTGVHHCTGSRLARMEIEVALNKLLDHVAAIEAGHDGLAEDSGYVLRAPEHLRVRLTPTETSPGR